MYKPDEFEVKPFDGLLPDRILMPKEGTVTWKVYIPEAGQYSVDISCHNFASTDVNAYISANQQQLTANLKPNGKVVVEPHEQYTDEFADNRIGAFNFTKPGYYEVSLKANLKPEQKLDLNRIWIEKIR